MGMAKMDLRRFRQQLNYRTVVKLLKMCRGYSLLTIYPATVAPIRLETGRYEGLPADDASVHFVKIIQLNMNFETLSKLLLLEQSKSLQ